MSAADKFNNQDLNILFHNVICQIELRFPHARFHFFPLLQPTKPYNEDHYETFNEIISKRCRRHYGFYSYYCHCSHKKLKNNFHFDHLSYWAHLKIVSKLFTLQDTFKNGKIPFKCFAKFFNPPGRPRDPSTGYLQPQKRISLY